MRYLAFDLGASSGKLFTGCIQHDKLAVQSVHSFSNSIVPFGKGLYWDFFRILTEMNIGIRKATTSSEIISLGIDSFNNDFSLLSPSGELLLPIRCYRDPKMAMYEERIYEKIPRLKLYAYTGNQIAPFNTFMQLASIALANQSAVFESASELLFLPDLLCFSITGQRQTEYTVAAESQFLNLHTAEWISDILEVFGIPMRIMPPVVMPGTKIGKAGQMYCSQNGIKPFEVIAVCQHDTASAFMSAPIDNAVYISSGTWSLVGIETVEPIITEETYRFNIANEGGYPGRQRLLKNVMGFWIMQEVLKEYAAEGRYFDFSQTQQLAAQSKQFRFMIDPNAPQFFMPGNMREKIREASIVNTGNAPETPGDYFRCIYEGLALRYRHAFAQLESVSGRNFSAISILGGGSQDAFACQCTANACGQIVHAGPCNASAIGNIIVQMLASGELGSIIEAKELLSRSIPLVMYEPTDTSMWNEHYARFLQICEAD